MSNLSIARRPYYSQQNMDTYIEYLDDKKQHGIRTHAEDVLKEILRDYKIVHLLGEGTFGSVYKGELKKTQEIVAIKCQQYTYAAEAEQECLVEIGHKPHINIINYRDWISIENSDDKKMTHSVQVMSYHPMNLRELYKNAKAIGLNISLQTIQDIARGVLSGLQHLETLGFTHLDIRPENLLAHDLKTVKITDFGSAVSVHDKLSTFNTISRWYRSPRVLALESTGNDIFSVACVIMELVKLEPLFVSETEARKPIKGLFAESRKKRAVKQTIKSEMRTHLSLVFAALGAPSQDFKNQIAIKEFKGRKLPKSYPDRPSIHEEISTSRAKFQESPKTLEKLHQFVCHLFNYEKPPSYEKALNHIFLTHQIEDLSSQMAEITI